MLHNAGVEARALVNPLIYRDFLLLSGFNTLLMFIDYSAVMEQNQTPRKPFIFPSADARREKLNSLLSQIQNGICGINLWGDDGGKERTLSYGQIERIAELSYNKDAFDAFLKEATENQKSDFCHELLVLSAATSKSENVKRAQEIQKQVICGLFEWFEPCKGLAYQNGLITPKTDEKRKEFPLLTKGELNDPDVQENLSRMHFIIAAAQSLAHTNFMSLAHKVIKRSEAADDVISTMLLRRTVAALQGYDKSAELTTNPMSFILGNPSHLYQPIAREQKRLRKQRGVGETSDGDENSPFANLSSREPDPSVAAEQKESAEIRSSNISDLMSELDDRQQIIINKRFFGVNGKISTLEDLGVELGVTKERVRQIEGKALKKLREAALRKGFTLE